MYKKIVAFSAIFALLFSGCADKSAGVKKIDEIQGLYAYNDGYYVVGDKYSFRLNETAKIDEAKRFYASEFANDIKDDFASICIYGDDEKMVGTYVIFLDKKLFSDERYAALKASFEMFDPNKNMQGSQTIKSFLESGYITGYYYLSGSTANISDAKRKEILTSGKFQNPIKVYTNVDCEKIGASSGGAGIDLGGAAMIVGLPVASAGMIVAFPAVFVVGAAFYGTFFVGWGLGCLLGLARCS